MEKTNIPGARPYDWAKASEDYAAYRDIYPDSFYEKILESGVGLAGQKVLAVGTGTGVLPRAMYKYGAKFHGVDINPGQINQALKLSEAKGMDIEWRTCPAENSGYPAGYFDAVAAIQCWHYFDPEVMVPEVHRLLKPGGKLAIGSMIWLPGESEIAAASEALVLQHNPDWTGGGMHRSAPAKPDWLGQQFKVEKMEAYDQDLPFTSETWRGRFRACRGIGATLSAGEVEAFDRAHQMLLQSVAPTSFTIKHQISLAIFSAL